jgi:hypothetical protein
MVDLRGQEAELAPVDLWVAPSQDPQVGMTNDHVVDCFRYSEV